MQCFTVLSLDTVCNTTSMHSLTLTHANPHIKRATGEDVPSGQRPQDRGGEERRQSGHLHASLSPASSLHSGLCQDRGHPQVRLKLSSPLSCRTPLATGRAANIVFSLLTQYRLCWVQRRGTEKQNTGWLVMTVDHTVIVPLRALTCNILLER